MPVEVKICGLTSAEAVDAAVAGGADFVGLVFFPPSPRSLSLERARALAARVPRRCRRVAVTVDADDDLLAAITAAVPVDLLQLHGSEPPDRVAEIRRRFRLPVMKAIAVADAADLATAAVYELVADRLLFDAKAPAAATRPGGNAQAFDWSLLRRITVGRPWMLAGGIDAGNVLAALRESGANAVDVSSGVEDAPGRKSVAAIAAFLALVKDDAAIANNASPRRARPLIS